MGIARSDRHLPSGLLALGGGKLARWTGTRWRLIPCGKVDFPITVLPPEKIGQRLTFRDEGDNEDDKRLAWLDLANPPGLTTFDRHVGVVGPEGPRWENVWSYARAGDGMWWISTGSAVGNTSLLRWAPREGYRVALYNDTTRWTGDFFTKTRSRELSPRTNFAVTGIEPRSDGGITAVGPHGLFSIKDGLIERLVSFERASENWTPSTLLSLDQKRTLLGGHWGGLILLQPKGATKIEALAIKPSDGNPIRF
ncbi:hypothetical protein EON81_26130 [bacterium]|nr:MAG: hypothetical protein EON81_26130 [bacterium]